MNLKLRWAAWGELTLKFLFIAGSIASLVGVIVPFLPEPVPAWAIGLLLLSTVFFIGLIALEIVTHARRRIYSKEDANGIKNYMHRWIDEGSRVAIWTRDLSWAQNTETRRLLRRKAEKSELILCMPESNPLATELAAAGAEVCDYGGDLLESPASRFTIAFFGRDGARVAVGRAEGELHVIEEFPAGGHPAFHLAADLVALARALCAQRRRE